MGSTGVAEILKPTDQSSIKGEFKHYVPICNHRYFFSIKYHEKYTRSVI